MIAAVLFVLSIVAANVITASTSPADIGPFLVTWGTWLVGATFILRDVVQLSLGRRAALALVAAGLVVSALSSALLGDTLAVVVASAAAFALGGLLDTEVFTRMPGRVPARVGVSGVVGGLLDTSVFVVVGLSPLWSGIIPWSAVPNAVLGVWLVKSLMQALAAAAWRVARGPEPMPAET